MLSRSTHKGLVVKLRTRWPWRALLVAAIASISTVAPVSPSFASAAAASSPVVATGTSISCSVNTGSLWCWGEGYGVAPVKVVGPGGSGFLTNVSAVSVGQDVCALSSGSAYCWGLGYPSLTQPPKNPILATGVTSIATSLTTSSACAVQSGALLCWGDNSNAQLGNGNKSYASSPTPVSGLSSAVTSISVSGLGACAIKSGSLYCWGRTALSNYDVWLTPHVAAGFSTSVSAVSIGAGGAPVAIKSGAMYRWIGSAASVVSGLGSQVTQVSLGATSGCAIKGAALYCWGDNSYGELGTGTYDINPRPSASAVPSMSSGVTSISVGSGTSCAVKSAALYCWGENQFGQVGNGTKSVSAIPVSTSVTLAGATSTAVGPTSSCAIKSSHLWCWGGNFDGQLGDGTSNSSASPVEVHGAGGTGFLSGVTSVSVGDNVACAVASGGAFCWGEVPYWGNELNPVGMPLLSSGVTQVVASQYGRDICAIKNSNLWCWGDNTMGQLGDGNTTESIKAMEVKGPRGAGFLSSVSAVSLGNYDTCAVSAGAAYCWGWGSLGQLGDASTGNWKVPAAVVGLTSGVTAIAAGSSTTCAIQSNAAKCWGSGSVDQLGNGIPAGSTSPVAVSGISSGASSISVGLTTACAVQSGQVKCWGQGPMGQLGVGNFTFEPYPTSPIGVPVGATSVAAGPSTSCASGPTTFCWGDNSYGQLGNGTSGNPALPTLVNSVS